MHNFNIQKFKYLIKLREKININDYIIFLYKIFFYFLFYINWKLKILIKKIRTTCVSFFETFMHYLKSISFFKTFTFHFLGSCVLEKVILTYTQIVKSIKVSKLPFLFSPLTVNHFPPPPFFLFINLTWQVKKTFCYH